jgi:hypothetical protein
VSHWFRREYYITLDADVVVANASNTKTFPGIVAEVWTFTAADINYSCFNSQYSC